MNRDYLKFLTMLIIALASQAIITLSFSQVPNKMSYQCVVRNAGGVLVQSSSVRIKISLLQGTTSGTVIYAETHSVSTNINGLATLEIGGGSVLSGTFATIDWSSGPYFLKTETDPTGGTNYTITGINQLLSVPYAFHSKTAENGFSGNYEDLSNKPVLFDGEYKSLTGFPTFATVAISGNYSDLTKLPKTISGFGITDAVSTTEDQKIAGNKVFSGTLGVMGNVVIGTDSPASSAVLEVSSISQGFLPPRMTYTQKISIVNPVAGLIIWCSNCGNSGEIQVYNGSAWTNMINEAASKALPNLTTIAISSIKSTGAFSGGNISNDGDATILARGVCWSTSANPTIADSKTLDGAGTGTFTSSISGLTIDITYYVKAYATNSAGTAYGNQLSFTTQFGIGDSFNGGKLAYILVSGDPGYIEGETHGLVAANTDQGTAQWYNGSYSTLGTTGIALGTGSTNTTSIINSLGNTGTYAAKICRDYTGGGYIDWYLPSINELGKLYLNRNAIGGFVTTFYWSSSESDNIGALGVSFLNGTLAGWSNKMNTYPVRAVRSF